MLAEALNINYSGGGTEIRSAAVHVKPVVFSFAKSFSRLDPQQFVDILDHNKPHLFLKGGSEVDQHAPHYMKYYGGNISTERK